MVAKLYTIWPEALWTRGRSNRLSYKTKVALAEELGLTDVVQLCTRPDPDWHSMQLITHDQHVVDSAKTPLWVLHYLASWLASPEHRVLIMCQRGRNRSVFLAGLVLWYRLGWSGEVIIEQLLKARPNCLSNPLFLAHLRSLPDTQEIQHTATQRLDYMLQRIPAIRYDQRTGILS